jgi:hypothetical protein
MKDSHFFVRKEYDLNLLKQFVRCCYTFVAPPLYPRQLASRRPRQSRFNQQPPHVSSHFKCIAYLHLIKHRPCISSLNHHPARRLPQTVIVFLHEPTALFISVIPASRFEKYISYFLRSAVIKMLKNIGLGSIRISTDLYVREPDESHQRRTNLGLPAARRP